jgi:ribosome recycling factor
MENPALKEMAAKMQRALDHTLHEFNSIHTGKASPAMVEAVMVEAYGSTMRLKECAAITTPDARMIQVQPWDKSIIRSIEKAIQMANLGINPIVDNAVIRLPLPEMSRERREGFVKQVRKMAEDGRVSLRNIRRETMEILKKAKADGRLTEDDLKRLEKDVQTATDKNIAEIEKHLQNKEKELLAI